LFAALALGACAAPTSERTAAPATPSGFLGAPTYALLQPGTGPTMASRGYVNRAADLRRYTQVMLEPVQFWRVPGDPEQLTPEQRQLTLNAFHDTLRSELARDFRIVDRPGPNTFVIATAITQVREGANPVLSNVATFIPQARLLREGASLMTGADPLVGGVNAEIKVTDALTGELLGAAIDSRDATMGARVRTSRWDDVQTVARYWAQLVRFRVCQAQARANCQAPAA
jgi:hypothetical protein